MEKIWKKHFIIAQPSANIGLPSESYFEIQYRKYILLSMTSHNDITLMKNFPR